MGHLSSQIKCRLRPLGTHSGVTKKESHGRRWGTSSEGKLAKENREETNGKQQAVQKRTRPRGP